MRDFARLPLLALALATAISAQPRWADASEYELARRISQEKEPTRQLEMLREWESLYPETEFQSLRLLTTAFAYKRAGQPSESFLQAERMLKLDPADIAASYLIVSIAPSLETPSPHQIRITREAAQRVLSHKPRAPYPSLETQKANAGAESDEVDTMIREWRRGKRVVDPEIIRRNAALKALKWAESFGR